MDTNSRSDNKTDPNVKKIWLLSFTFIPVTVHSFIAYQYIFV